MNNPTQLPPWHFYLPGPTEVDPEVLAAQTMPMIGHRGPAIESLIDELQQGLRRLFMTERPVLISTSSATGLMEAAVRNGVTAGGRVLSLVNGAFSGRFADLAAACGHDTDRWTVDWGEVHRPEELEERLGRGSYDAVTITHSETSTGALQDLESMAEVVRAHEGVLLLVDSVTGVAGAEVRTDDWGLDFVLTGSQKALALPPGLAFGVASPAMMSRSALAANKGLYFDLVSMMKSLDAHQTPNTPAVSLLYALQAQLARIESEGLEERWKRHIRMREMVEAWVDETSASGIDVGILAPAGHRSPTVTSLTLPDGRSGSKVVAEMLDRGWVIGAGYGKLKDVCVRIGHMGDHRPEVLAELLSDLTAVLA